MVALIPESKNYRPLDSTETRHISLRADVDITAGQPVYVKPNGRCAPAAAGAVGTAKVVGIATRDVFAGEVVDAQIFGRCAGYTNLEAQPQGTPVYLGTTAGQLSTDVGTIRVPVGTVYRDTRIGGQDRAYIYLDVSQAFVPTA